MSQKESINEKIERLKAEVEWFYGDDFDLAVAVERYSKAAKLAKDVEKSLNELKNEVKIVAEDFSKA